MAASAPPYLLTLPLELQIGIASYLDTEDVISFRNACRRLAQAGRYEIVKLVPTSLHCAYQKPDLPAKTWLLHLIYELQLSMLQAADNITSLYLSALDFSRKKEDIRTLLWSVNPPQLDIA